MSKVTVAPAKNTTKSKELTKINLAVSTKKAAAKEITRELKWIYPADATTPLAKKEFRRKSRQSLKRYEKTLASLKESNKKEDKAELKKIQDEYVQFQQKSLNPRKAS